MTLYWQKEAQHMGELIGILSGKGGTGKTSVCAGIAEALALQGEKVLCIDCDVGLRNLDIALGISQVGGLSFLDVCSGEYDLSMAAKHPVYPNISFLTAPMNTSAGAIDEKTFGAFLFDARRWYDYVLLDAPAGVDTGFQLVSSVADRFLLVTGSGPAAIRDAARVGELLELKGRTDVRLIVNRVNRNMLSLLKMTIDDVMDRSGLPLIGVVLEDADVPLAAACGMCLLHYSRRSAAAVAFKKIAKRIQGYNQPITLR
jgi:septum site-determining protein MinD